MESFPVRVIKKILHIPTKFPYFIQLAITDACNLDCEICPRHHVHVKPAHLDFEVFTRIVDRLEGAKEISLVGLGEPFVYPKIFEAIRYCKAKGLTVKTTTNGLLLDTDDVLMELIRSGLDSISFSIESLYIDHGNGKFHANYHTVQYIERLISLKKKYRAATPKIVLQPVLIKGKEADIYEMIEFFAPKGISRVNVLRMTTYFETGVARPNMEEEQIIFRQFDRLRAQYHVRIDCLQDQFFGGITGLLYKYFKNFLRIDSCCTRLLDYPYITVHGDVIPCCVLPEVKFGNVLEENIQDIWHGEAFNHFRKHHHTNTLCAKCDNLKIKQIVSHAQRHDRA